MTLSDPSIADAAAPVNRFDITDCGAPLLVAGDGETITVRGE